MRFIRRQLFEAAEAGHPAELSGAEVPGDLLLEVLTGRANVKVHPRGLRLHDARIVGELNWDWQRLPVPLAFVSCMMDDRLVLDHAQVAKVSLSDCHLSGFSGERLTSAGGLTITGCFLSGPVDLVDASIAGSVLFDGTQVEGDVDQVAWQGERLAVRASRIRITGFLAFSGGFRAKGAVVLPNAEIGGNLNLANGQFCNAGGLALNAVGAKVDGNVVMVRSFHAEGDVTLNQARVGRNVTLDGGHIDSPGSEAFSADSIDIAGGLFMRRGFSVTGRVRLLHARVGANWECEEASFSNADGDDAVWATGVRVAGNVFFRNGTKVAGRLRMIQARIDGSLSFHGASLSSSGNALTAFNIVVAGDLWFSGGFTADAPLRLGNARISGDMDCAGAMFKELDATGATVAGRLRWRGIAPTLSSVDLRRAHVGELDDDDASWPAGKIMIAGFVYDRLSRESPQLPGQRIRWIRRQPSYGPEPYQQLAAVYRANGQVDEETLVAMAQQDDLVQRGDLGRFARAWRWFLGKSIGHGYRPARAAWALLILYLITVGTVWAGARADAFIQVGDIAPQVGVTASHCEDAYPCLSPLAYSLENITPILNLHQAENWQPKSRSLPTKSLRAWLYLSTVFGYGATTLLIAALTGLARNP